MLTDVVQVWEQPADVPMPAEPGAIRAQLEQWRARVQTAPNPKFVELAHLVNKRLAGDDEEDGDDPPFVGAPLDGRTEHFVWSIGLGGGERHEEVHAVLATYAMALGLNLADGQADRLYLADGRILSPDPAAQCTPALALYHGGDDAGAWQAFLDLGARGNPAAIYQLAAMVQAGLTGRENVPLTLALLMLSGHRDDAQQLAARLRPEQVEAAGHLLDRLRAQPGDFKTLVDTAAKPLGRAPAAAPRSPATPPAPPAPVSVPAPAPASVPEAAAPRPAARPPARDPAPDEELAPSAGVDATIALLAGVVGVPVALLLGPWISGWLFWLLLAGSLAAGAWGAWHSGRARGWESSQVVFYTVVAVLPIVGVLACLRLLNRRS